MSQKVNTIVGFVIIGIIVATVLVLTNLFLKKQAEIAQIQIPVPTPIQKEIDQNKADLADTQPANSVQNTDMQGWKVYKNDHYGIEYKYPQNWVFMENPDESPHYISFHDKNLSDPSSKPTFTILVVSSSPDYINNSTNNKLPTPTPEEVWQKSYSKYPIVIIGNNIKARQLPSSGCAREIAFFHDGYEFHYVDNESACNNSGQIQKQILSTFKFTDSVDTSGWKTYRSVNPAFKFKYPFDWVLLPKTNEKYAPTDKILMADISKIYCCDKSVDDGVCMKIFWSSDAQKYPNIENIISKKKKGSRSVEKYNYGKFEGIKYESVGAYPGMTKEQSVELYFKTDGGFYSIIWYSIDPNGKSDYQRYLTPILDSFTVLN